MTIASKLEAVLQEFEDHISHICDDLDSLHYEVDNSNSDKSITKRLGDIINMSQDLKDRISEEIHC